MPQWTAEQQLAIERTGCDLLVSASAGTGKTAVLVERIVRLALDGPAPADLDRFLVVTFTEAAAAEMRERIGAALRGRIEAAEKDVRNRATSPAERRLRRQLLLLDRAQISTLHAFCSSLLRQHYHRLGLDPEFAILPEDDGRLLRAERAREVLAAAFRDGEPRFLRWLDTLAGANPETEAERRILSLHAFRQSLEDPPGWTERVRAAYPLDAEGAGAEQPFEAHDWFVEWRESLRRATDSLDTELEHLRALALRLSPIYADKWIALADEALDEALTAVRAGRWAVALDALRAVKFPALPRFKGSTEEPHATVKAAIDAFRKRFEKEVLGDLAVLSASGAARAHAATAGEVHLLLDLAERFERDYSAAKRRQRALDFNDLEQLALRVLRDGGPGGEAARACRDRFEYVLVDEYQDTNPVQEAILGLVSRGGDAAARPNNLFAVGDVKQSIYEFRLAAPEVFLAKYDAFPPAGPTPPTGAGARERTLLGTNFRSRPQVLAAVNTLFGRLMRREIGGLDYDAAAALRPNPGSTTPAGDPRDYVTEVHFLERAPAKSGNGEDDTTESGSEEPTTEDVADWEALEREAWWVGRRILEMTGRGPGGPAAALRVAEKPSDAASPSLRPARFGDIVVLVRSLRTAGDTFLSVFGSLGIPVFADRGAGLSSSPPVRDLLNLLRLLDNPLQDIPLAAVLRSPLEGWTGEELARVRVARTDGPFHEALRAAAALPEAECAVGPRAAEFLGRIDAWRTRARREPLADLLAALSEETGTLQRAAASPGAETGLAHLRRLYDLGREFGTFARQGLARFLEFVEDLRRENEDLGGATPPPAGPGDVVRLLTIHKSKGLEFPVVFLPALGGQFNMGDVTRSPQIVSRHGALALAVSDRERMQRYASPGLRSLRRERRQARLAEEMRILYVALTRAREKLVLTASVKNLAREAGRWLAAAQPGTARLDPALLARAQGCAHWIGPALGLDTAARGALEALAQGAHHASTPLPEPGAPLPPWTVALHGAGEVAAWTTTAEEVTSPALGAEAPAPAVPLEEEPRTTETTPERYAFEALARCPARVAAGEARRRLEGIEEPGEPVHRLMREETDYDLERIFAELPERAAAKRSASPIPPPSASRPPATAANRGSWTHLVLQHVDLLAPLDEAGLSAQAHGLVEAGFLTEEQREAVDLGAIACFFASPVGRRLAAAPPDRVWREVPFLLGVAPQDLGLAPPGLPSESERVRVQGVMDCVFEEDGGLVLLDYKTDAIAAEAVPLRRALYLPQVRLYARALAAAFPGRPLREAYLCFLAPGAAERLSAADIAPKI